MQDLKKMESLSSKNKNIKYLLCVVDVFTKTAQVKPLKNENGKKDLDESNHKSNKLWVDQGREFYNELM